MGVDYLIVRYDKDTKTWTEDDYWFYGNDHLDAPDYDSQGFPMWELEKNEILIADTWDHFWDDDGNIIQAVCDAYVAAYPTAWGHFWKFQWLRNEPEEHWPDFLIGDLDWYPDLAV
jgi:hypothetical protein